MIRSPISFIALLVILLYTSCVVNKDDFRSLSLVSSKGEKLYINTLNWGVSGDSQLTSITHDPNTLLEGRDTTNTVSGLQPFMYNFSNDTLSICYNGEVDYRTTDDFKSITILYFSLDNPRYMEAIRGSMVKGKIFRQVP